MTRRNRNRSRPTRYADRTEAGNVLAEHLRSYAGRPEVVVLGLPRGGVVTAAAVAERLGAPLDVFCVRKLGVPWHRELAMGAVATGGVQVLNESVVRQLNISPEDIARIVDEERAELVRREAAYRGDRPPLDLHDRIAVLVDDGLATGATARAALLAVRRLQPAKAVLAVPVAPSRTTEEFTDVADEVICPLMPSGFDAVGRWYDDFRSTTDDEVRRLLALR